MRYVLCLLVAFACCVQAAKLHELAVDDFVMQWPEGFVDGGNSQPRQFIGPNGLGLTVTAIPADGVPGATAAARIETLSDYAENTLAALAQKHGAVVVPLQHEALKSGSILYFVACDTVVEGKPYFGLFFAIISSDGSIAQLVVEGPGKAKEQFPTFRPFMDTARWRT